MSQTELIKDAAKLIVNHEPDEAFAERVITNLLRALDITQYKDVNQIAMEQGLSAARVRQIAKELGIGSLVGGLTQFTSEEEAQIKGRNLVSGWPKGKPYAPRRRSYGE